MVYRSFKEMKDPFERLADRVKESIMNKGLAFRLTLFFIFISLLPLLVQGFIALYVFAGSANQRVGQFTSDIISEMNINLFLRFSKIDDMSKTILNNSVVMEILSKDKETADSDFIEDNPKMMKVLQSICFSNEYITSAYILPAKHNNVYASGVVTGNYGENYFSPKFRAEYKESDEYIETYNEYKNYIWWAPKKVLGQRVFVLTRKLFDVEQGVLGVLVIHVNDKMVSDIYDKPLLDDNILIFLTDSEGTIIHHPDKNMLDTKVSEHDWIHFSQKDKGSFVSNENGKKYFKVFDTFFVTGWKFVASIPYDHINKDAVTIRNTTVLIALSCIFAVILMSYFLSKSVVNPVRHLINLMKQGSSGNMKVRFRTKYNDEIGHLGESFNSMMSEIEKLIDMVREENKQKVEAQIRALEAHINPHFLYNAMASIYWNAVEKENHEIAEMASSLSNFFKLSLNRGKEFTTIQNEVEHVREYLNIQNMMYNNKFDVIVDVQHEILNYKTIKLILQPLAENALFHGLANKKERGLIKIEVFKKEEKIVFRVSDNGCGIKDLSEKGLQSIIDSGYGIKNIQSRLRLYFSDNFSINCESMEGMGTVFEIIIPALPEEV